MKLRAGRVSTAVLLILTAGAGPYASASFPGRDGRIVYTRSPFTDEDQEIFTIAADGTNRKRLTDNGSGDTDAVWNAAGSKIAFQCDAPFGDTPSHRGGSICVMRGDGSGRRRLTNRALSDSAPSWAPGGQRIVFIRYFRTDTGTQTDLVVIDVSSGRLRRLTRTDVNETSPTWSPDGNTIAFVASSRGGDVFTITASGRHRRNLTGSPGGESSVNWAPGGRRLVFARFTETYGQQIYIASKSGRRVRRVTSGGETKFSPAWSPEGGHIVFSEGDDLFKMRIDGSHVVRLTGAAETREAVEAQADWQPQ